MVTHIHVHKNETDLYCPVCGREVMFTVLHGNTPCRHVLYSYIELFEVFKIYHQCDDELEQAVLGESGETDDGEWLDPVEVLIQKIDQSSILHLRVETHGVACAPMSNSVYVGFEFNVE